MYVIGKDILDKAKKKYTRAAKTIDAWVKTVENAQWRHFMELKETLGSASNVDDYVVFNIGGNKYRLTTVIQFPPKIIFVRAFLTHAQYDDKTNWDKGVL